MNTYIKYWQTIILIIFFFCLGFWVSYPWRQSRRRHYEDYMTNREIKNRRPPNPPRPTKFLRFQDRVGAWVKHCFGDEMRYNRQERAQRFLEEALELVQAVGMSKADAITLVSYTYGRPVGVVKQEVGGTMVTLAALCDALAIDMVAEGETELDRVLQPEITEKIRMKQATKPSNSPLPGTTPGQFVVEAYEVSTGVSKGVLADRTVFVKMTDKPEDYKRFNSRDAAAQYAAIFRAQFQSQHNHYGFDLRVVPA